MNNIFSSQKKWSLTLAAMLSTLTNKLAGCLKDLGKGEIGQGWVVLICETLRTFAVAGTISATIGIFYNRLVKVKWYLVNKAVSFVVNENFNLEVLQHKLQNDWSRIDNCSLACHFNINRHSVGNCCIFVNLKIKLHHFIGISAD